MVIKETAETLLVIAVLAVLAAATVFMMVELWQSASQMRGATWRMGVRPRAMRRAPHPLQRSAFLRESRAAARISAQAERILTFVRFPKLQAPPS
jgi:hypothetical protein